MTRIAASAIIVSRDRPRLLSRCLTSLGQQFHDQFEVIVVADPQGIEAARSHPLAVKLVSFDEANISAARSLGVAQASTNVVAFIDDDAAAEPTWLDHLTTPFSNPEVSAAGGFVRGRNGMSFQWKAQWLNEAGTPAPLVVDGDDAELFTGREDFTIKTEGTNCAFRKDVLVGMGGFDPAFRFYLDETDVNMRLARMGAVTAIVPLAQVHHGFAESNRRRRDRAPRDLYEIGASCAVFARKYPKATGYDEQRDQQRKGLLGHMVEGRLEPRDISNLLETFDDGWSEGMTRPVGGENTLHTQATSDFLPIRTSSAPTESVCLSGRIWQAGKLRKQARDLVRGGKVVTLILLSPTFLRHRQVFHLDGYWEQSGGVMVQDARRGRVFPPLGLGQRISYEWKSLEKLRIMRKPECACHELDKVVS